MSPGAACAIPANQRAASTTARRMVARARSNRSHTDKLAPQWSLTVARVNKGPRVCQLGGSASSLDPHEATPLARAMSSSRCEDPRDDRAYLLPLRGGLLRHEWHA